MIKYALQDIDDNQYELSGATIDEPAKSSVSFLSERFSFDSKITQNSFLPGAVKLGKTRLESSILSLQLSRAHPVSDDFKTAENELMRWLEKTVYLVDLTNAQRIKVNLKNVKINYDPGGHKLSSDNIIQFSLLSPYWEANTQTQVGPDVMIIDINNVALNNQGNLNAYPEITFTAAVAVTQIELYIDETKHGMRINDALFGTDIYLTMIIDCEQGTILIGELDRSASILSGTGYFYIPVGASSLKVIPTAECNITVKWRKRAYV